MWANHYTQNKVIRILLVSVGGDVRKVENDAYLFQSLSCFYLIVRSATSHAPLHYLADGAGARPSLGQCSTTAHGFQWLQEVLTFKKARIRC